MNCLFLVSDEGYGHTVRQSCIANELAKRGAKITFQCRDPIPLATKILNKNIKIYNQFNLVRLVKQDGGVDVERTYNFFKNYITISKDWIKYMLNSPHVLNADIIVTDIVEEAGILSNELNKPTVAISHFTWHWLLRELDQMFEEIAQYLETCLSGISEFLYPPFSKRINQFPNPKPINLIARIPRKREYIREELKINDDEILIILAGGGTPVWRGIFNSIDINKNNQFVFLTDSSTISNNIKRVPKPFKLHDYINASDLVISRGGYGTISETLAYGVRHLILVEENHPEAIENANILRKVDHAMVRNLNNFLNEPYDLIEESLNIKMNLAPMRSDGHIQAADHIFKILDSFSSE